MGKGKERRERKTLASTEGEGSREKRGVTPGENHKRGRTDSSPLKPLTGTKLFRAGTANGVGLKRKKERK